MRKAQVTQLFPRRSKGVLERPMRQIQSIPVSHYIKAADSDGVLFRYMFPVPGRVMDFLLSILELEGKPQASLVFQTEKQKREYITDPLHIGNQFLEEQDVEKGEQLTIRLLDPVNSSVNGLWLSFSYRQKTQVKVTEEETNNA